MKVALVNPQYLYGVSKFYLNCSLVSVGARLKLMGHTVTLLDFNIDRYGEPAIHETLQQSDVIGFSLLGAPYIPAAIELSRKIQNDFPGKVIAYGGQTIENISRSAFGKLFGSNESIKQIVDDSDIAKIVGVKSVYSIPHPLSISFIPVWEEMNQEHLRKFMRHEMTLEVSRGCIFECEHCAARKAQKEQFRNAKIFEQDLRFLAQRAKTFGITELQFYASSLDFFQTPSRVGEILCILARVQKEEGMRIKVRCLSCMATFLHARQTIENWIAEGREIYRGFHNFSDLLRCAGLWCIGFGVDGADESVWERLNKRHNKSTDIPMCIKMCRQMGIRTEILMVMGFPRDEKRTLWKTVMNSLRYAASSPFVILRPYHAKMFVPGNEGWNEEIEKIMIEDTQLFYNIDFCALGSRLTNPNRFHRWLGNLAYIATIAILTPFRKCNAVPLLPQGEKGIYGTIAKIFNRIMPPDR